MKVTALDSRENNKKIKVQCGTENFLNTIIFFVTKFLWYRSCTLCTNILTKMHKFESRKKRLY
jgi:hypothetical protein